MLLFRMPGGFPPIFCGYPATYPRRGPASLRFAPGTPAAQPRCHPVSQAELKPLAGENQSRIFTRYALRDF